ncbi:MAG TPA: hypothetical protein DEV93_15955 [Chloroflexi bacterium]|jgi:hypothetical protein|nr:hypothetical protein [Chloroflexota bacterium]
MAGFDGHNGFIGAGGKGHSIRILRRVSQLTDVPTADAVEGYLAAHPKVRRGGAAKVRHWYEEIRQGKRHRDPGGRSIS